MNTSTVPEAEDAASESEWEYEYDDCETETFYVTLDLSSNSKSQAHDPESQKASFLESGKPIVEQQWQQQGRTSSGEPDHSVDAGRSLDTVQILDLPSANPFVKYEGEVYSCQWGSTIGTDLTFAPADTDFPVEPLHRDKEFQIVSKSAVRLTGTPTKLLAKPPSLQYRNLAPNGEASAAFKVAINPNGSDPGSGRMTSLPPAHAPPAIEASEVPPISISVGSTSSDDRLQQAHFLERIANMKRGRSDADEVPIYKLKRYNDLHTTGDQQEPIEESSRAVFSSPTASTADVGDEAIGNTGSRKRVRFKTITNTQGSAGETEVPTPSTPSATMDRAHGGSEVRTNSPPMMHGALPDTPPETIRVRSTVLRSSSRNKPKDIPESG